MAGAKAHGWRRPPTHPGLNTGNGWGAAGQTLLEPGGRRSSTGSIRRARECGHSGEPRDTMGRPASPRRCPAPRARVAPGTRGLELPSAANYSANRSNHRTTRLPGAHTQWARPQAPIYPKCIKLGACPNGRRPGGPPVDKQHSLRGVGGGWTVPSTHHARPSGSPTQPSPARDECPC